ncbi:MAG: DinB family protein [Candidatus Dojkabacteria bacterium]
MKKSAEIFLESYLSQHRINRKFFELVPESKYDFKMTKSSDSIRDNLAHIIAVTRNYLEGVEQGVLDFNSEKYADLNNSKDKKELLEKLAQEIERMKIILGREDIESIIVKTPWGNVKAVDSLYGLKDHEILHTGINLALMDHLEIPRFDELKAMWG